MTNIAMERSTILNGKIHYQWPCSIAMLVYQRVSQVSVGLGRSYPRPSDIGHAILMLMLNSGTYF